MHKHPLYLSFIAALVTLPGHADHLEELVVSASHDSRTIDITDELVISADIAQLLKKAPGANVNSNGPIVGIPQYRGMSGARIATSLDQNQLAPAGPNWMDPPLSYATSGQLESLEIYRGIAPVSAAQESIGGAIDAKSSRGSFTSGSRFSLSGRIITSVQSVNSGYNFNTAVFAANDTHRIKIAAMAEAADDAKFSGGDISPSEYRRQRFDLGYGLRLGDHSVQLDYGYNDTSDAGTPALPMDIDYIEGDHYNFSYQFDLAQEAEITASIYGSDLNHGMSNYHLRTAPTNRMQWRRNIADSKNLGFNLHSKLLDAAGSWAFGFDGFKETHSSNIDNPNNAAFFVDNFNDTSREILGVFIERQQDLNDYWRGEVGVRYNRVAMDAGEVNGTPAIMMPPAQILRDTFNSASRSQTDHNIDVVVKAWYRADDTTSWYIGASQKHRSPSYQERYLWLPLQATAGLADGLTYTGNIDLVPEVAHQLEFGFDFSNSRLTLSPRIFYSDVKDYIQGTPTQVAPAVMFVRMLNTMNASNNPDPLQFNNVDAQLWGFDMDWAWQLSPHWTVSGLLNYVRGKRSDIEDELYRIAPANASVRLNYSRSNWSASAESVMYNAQNKVSETNREAATAGHTVVNVSTTWQASPSLQLAIGVDNLFNKEFKDHLGGYNRATNSDIDKGERLPGYGTNVFGRLSYTF